MTPWPAWLRLGLLLPVLGLNAFVLKRLLVQFAPFPGLFLTAAFGPALPLARAAGSSPRLGHRQCGPSDPGASGLGGCGTGAALD